MTPSKSLEHVDMPTHQEQRSSERIPLIQPCPYELSRVPGGGGVELSHGYALTVNISSGGMLLLMPQAPDERQIFEVQAPSLRTQAKSSTKLVEVCWTRQLPMGAEGSMHSVGVRFLFEVPTSQ